MKNSQLHDLVGIGFGPANIALAIALEELLPDVSARFIDGRESPAWQEEMMLPGSDIQNHPARDLVTLRNPQSRYTFLNYLFEQGRLLDHLNLPAAFPLRREYAKYVRWAAQHFSHLTEFGSPAAGVRLEEVDGAPAYVVTTESGDEHAGRALVVGTGRTPYIPAPFGEVLGPRVFHLTQYRSRLAGLPRAPERVAVIGGSQSAVEITLDLARRYPDAEIVNYVRSFGLRLKDTSPFSEEGYFPQFTRYYYGASREGKRALDRYMRPTNYSSADADVLAELYMLMYEQRLDDRQRVFVRGNRVVTGVGTGAGIGADAGIGAGAHGAAGRNVKLAIAETITGETEQDEADFVVLATGFRDLGPGEGQEAYPALLSGVIDQFAFDEDGYLAVAADYALRGVAPDTPPLFLNGLCESSHGIGDSGSFSLLSLRAATIADGYRRRMAAPDLSQAAGLDIRTLEASKA